MRALIVDDELYAREELEALLHETGEFTLAGKCANAFEALEKIRKEKPDVLFLDIQMPVVGGFEMIGMIDEEHMPLIVFVTAYDQYAIKAFEENALDYLLKPVEKERLAKTVSKLKKMAGEGKKTVFTGPEITRIPCCSFNRIKLVNMADVEFVRSDLAGVYVVTPKGEYYTELTLKVLENRAKLVRCHRQYLVNIDAMDEILLHENLAAQIQTRSGRLLPVSRRHLRRLKERLGI